jgi:hypothetical protein
MAAFADKALPGKRQVELLEVRPKARGARAGVPARIAKV